MPTFQLDEDKVREINEREDKGNPPPLHTPTSTKTNVFVVEDVHYDPTAEVRSRGVGHYTFSADNKSRAEQMTALNEARDETEQQRTAAQKAAETRRIKIEERRKEIAGKKRKREAEKFLSGLDLDLGSSNSG